MLTTIEQLVAFYSTQPTESYNDRYVRLLQSSYNNRDEYGVSVLPEDCYGCLETDPQSTIDFPEYM